MFGDHLFGGTARDGSNHDRAQAEEQTSQETAIQTFPATPAIRLAGACDVAPAFPETPDGLFKSLRRLEACTVGCGAGNKVPAGQRGV